ncbi:hypothetical protein K435DRAFT_602049, partial [Dendrothele bispora CBS 962.96]
MPSSQYPKLPHWMALPETKEDLDYAQLPAVDLDEATTALGRAKLSKQVVDALVQCGSFYVVNHGYSSTQMDRMHDIANLPFEQLSMGQKQDYTTDSRRRESKSLTDGYKFRQYYV